MQTKKQWRQLSSRLTAQEGHGGKRVVEKELREDLGLHEERRARTGTEALRSRHSRFLFTNSRAPLSFLNNNFLPKFWSPSEKPTLSAMADKNGITQLYTQLYELIIRPPRYLLFTVGTRTKLENLVPLSSSSKDKRFIVKIFS